MTTTAQFSSAATTPPSQPGPAPRIVSNRRQLDDRMPVRELV